jgi:hypothetical protein
MNGGGRTAGTTALPPSRCRCHADAITRTLSRRRCGILRYASRSSRVRRTGGPPSRRASGPHARCQSSSRSVRNSCNWEADGPSFRRNWGPGAPRERNCRSCAWGPAGRTHEGLTGTSETRLSGREGRSTAARRRIAAARRPIGAMGRQIQGIAKTYAGYREADRGFAHGDQAISSAPSDGRVVSVLRGLAHGSQAISSAPAGCSGRRDDRVGLHLRWADR